MKDHEIRELVNQLRDVAIKYHGAGQLREQIARVVRAHALQAEPDKSASKLPGVIDDNLVEGLRLLQCMLDDYRERNYGHAQDWVRHIDQRFSEYSEAHGDDAYCIFHRILAGEGDSNSQAIGIDLASGPDCSVEVRYVAPPGYVMVPKEPTEEMLQASYREAAVYSPTAYRAMIAAAPQSPGSEPATVPGKWIPVSEQMPIEFEAVIAFDGDQVYGEAMYSSDDGFTIDGYEPCDRLNLRNVTHWMPLPSAPQEVK